MSSFQPFQTLGPLKKKEFLVTVRHAVEGLVAVRSPDAFFRNAMFLLDYT
jgi:hypothetical protein